MENIKKCFNCWKCNLCCFHEDCRPQITEGEYCIQSVEYYDLEQEATKIHLENKFLISYEELNTFVYVLERIRDSKE